MPAILFNSTEAVSRGEAATDQLHPPPPQINLSDRADTPGEVPQASEPSLMCEGKWGRGENLKTNKLSRSPANFKLGENAFLATDVCSVQSEPE